MAMTSPPRTIDEVFEYAFLIARDAKRIANDLDRHRLNESDHHRLSEMHRLRQALLDFSHAMQHIEARLRELGIIE